MTVTTQRPTRSVAPPAVTGRVVLWGALAVNVLIVEALWFTAGEGKNGILTVAKFFGLHAALIMMFQLILIARLPWLDRRIGMDRLTGWHRWVGFTLLWTIILHSSLVVLGYATLDGVSPIKTFFALAGVTASLLGMFAAGIIVIVAALSIRYIRRRLQYETWHAIHVLMYVAITIALIHQALEGTTFTSSALAKAYWWTMWTLVLVALFVGRIVMPFWRNAYHQFRVAAVVPESDNTVSVHVTGRRLDKLPAKAGQFFIWRFPGHRGWWLANPFSMSMAPNGRSLRLTAKASGKGSAGLRNLTVGNRVFAEGPYGAFTTLHQTRDSILLIAGGVGVTPIRSLLEEATGPVTVLYRVPNMADAVLLAELQQLARPRGAQVHVLTGRTGAGNPPNTPFEPANLIAMVPDIRERDIFICGPTPMTMAVIRSLRALGVPRGQIHAELFSLA
jgi:predicted ferric reductase